MKLIDMEKVLSELCLSHKDIIYIDKNETAERIRKIPSIDIDRPQGEWIEHHKPFTWMGFTYWTCSECGYGKNNQNGIQSNFCPNCGARMKGADDEINSPD